jgi:hypothetical protein
MKSHTSGNTALKINISKAFDRIRWNYLQAVLLRLGFAEAWVDYIMFCVTNVSSTVCFNGSEDGPIKLMLSQFILELFSKVYLFFSFPIKKIRNK